MLMTIRNYELGHFVTLNDVAQVLEAHSRDSTGGTHEVDLGEAGYHTVYCNEDDESRLDVEVILNELARRVRS